MRRILPGLEAGAMYKIVQRLPIIEGLVAVGDWGVRCRYESRHEQEIECYVEWDQVG